MTRDPSNGSALPVNDPARALHPTALRILEAAKRLLVERGFEAVTLEAIAAEAGVNKAATRYYFGSKAGLLSVMVDEIVLDECASIASDVGGGLSDEERLDTFVENIRRMTRHVDGYSGFFDILPHAVRDRHLRARMVYLYDVWYDWNIEWLGFEGLWGPEVDDELRSLGMFAAAVADGMAVQAMIHGKDYDPEPVLRTLRAFLADVRVRMKAAARTSQGGEHPEVAFAADLGSGVSPGDRLPHED
jgi:AcrR family transcriptional regulator